MKILSLNINGLRAFINNDRCYAIEDYFEIDVLCFQEVKATPQEADPLFDVVFPQKAYTCASQFKKGYAGVATLLHKDLQTAGEVLAPEIMEEYGSGRLVTVEFRDFVLVNVYTLNSGNKESFRKEWDIKFRKLINTLKEHYKKPIMIVGDLNVVAGELDHYNYWAAKGTMPGLYQFELDNFKLLLEECDLVDSFRYRNPNVRAYSWYSYMDQARKKNLGWRIDYCLVSPELLPKLQRVKVMSDINASDHCPIYIEINAE